MPSAQYRSYTGTTAGGTPLETNAAISQVSHDTLSFLTRRIFIKIQVGRRISLGQKLETIHRVAVKPSAREKPSRARRAPDRPP